MNEHLGRVGADVTALVLVTLCSIVWSHVGLYLFR
jgi:hypothetical protein